MTEWREFKIKDIADVVGGGTPSTAINEYWNGDIPWLTPKDLTGYIRNFISHGERFITKKGLENSSARLLPKGTVLLTSRAPIGYVAIAENEICTNQGFKSLVPNPDKAHNLFLLYWIKSNVEYLQSIGTGTTFQEISGSVLKDVDIILPPLPEQKAIAEVLSSLDDKIDLLTRQNNTLEDLGQAFFRKWFVEDADEKLKKYPLSELMVIQNGFAFRSRDYQDAGKYKIVTIKNVQDGFIDTSGTTFLNQLPVGMPDYVLLTIGDVLISLTGNVGRVGIVVEDNLLLNQRVAKISPYNPEYLPFLYFYFRNETTREYLINLAHGTAQANLSPIETLKTEVSFSKTLIKKYSELFMPMYQKIIKNKQQIIVLQKLRDTLLPKLISGEIRVKM